MLSCKIYRLFPVGSLSAHVIIIFALEHLTQQFPNYRIIVCYENRLGQLALFEGDWNVMTS